VSDRGAQDASGNRLALVTGASRGIGRGIAVELARAGYSVAVNYRDNLDAALETVRLCETEARSVADSKSRRKFFVVRADISDSDARERMVDQVRREAGDINLLVNNAGMAPRQRADILEASEASFEELIRTNLQGPYFLTQRIAAGWIAAAGDGSAAARGGTVAGDSDAAGATSPRHAVIFITSISADTASLNRGEYCVSKAGLAMTVQLFAWRLAEYGIPVFELRPGIMKTDMTGAVQDRYERLIAEGLVPQKRWGTPEDVGKAARALASGSFRFSTGSVVHVDGGLHIARL